MKTFKNGRRPQKSEKLQHFYCITYYPREALPILMVQPVPGCGLMTFASILRLFSTDPTAYLVTAHLGSISNAVSGVIVMAAPAALSASWFPADQRTTATTISQVANGLGNAVSFYFGPLLVPDDYLNKTTPEYGFIPVLRSDLTDPPSVEDVRVEIWWYMLAQAVPATVIFIAMVVYFPSKPALPPSHSASSQIDRTPFKESIVALLTNKNALMCLFALSLSLGVQGTWSGVMTLNFEPLGKPFVQSGPFIWVTASYFGA